MLRLQSEWESIRGQCQCGVGSSWKGDAAAWTSGRGRGGSEFFPPHVRALTSRIACQKAGSEFVLDVEGVASVTAAPTEHGDTSQSSGPAATQLRSFVRTEDDTGKTVVDVPVSRFSARTIAWIMSAIGVVATVSARTVARWLKADKLKPWRFRSWITPKDLTKFMPRACAVLDLYERVAQGLLQAGEIVYSVDEKTSIQARQRATNEPPRPGRPARVQHTYARRGAVNLIAALDVSLGTVIGTVCDRKNFPVFSAFLVELIDVAVASGKDTIHFILDNGSLHRPKHLENWLREHCPHVTVVVHWLPVRSSWLNQIEIFFGILQRHVLQPNDFPDLRVLGERILRFIAFYNVDAEPINWTYTSRDLKRKYESAEQVSRCSQSHLPGDIEPLLEAA